MINRIVRMSFMPEKVDEFLAVFNAAKDKIASFDGCEGLTLLRDAAEPNVLYTYSYWQSIEKLNKYRFSDLFKTTWANTKILFNNKAVAYSLMVEQKVK